MFIIRLLSSFAERGGSRAEAPVGTLWEASGREWGPAGVTEGEALSA